MFVVGKRAEKIGIGLPELPTGGGAKIRHVRQTKCRGKAKSAKLLPQNNFQYVKAQNEGDVKALLGRVSVAHSSQIDSLSQ